MDGLNHAKVSGKLHVGQQKVAAWRVSCSHHHEIISLTEKTKEKKY